MTLATYTQLADAVADWLDRDDLAARVPNFIALTEARLNRLLEDPSMEVVLDTTTSGGEITLPDEFGQLVSVSTPYSTLHAGSPSDFASFGSVSGNPRWYIIEGGVMRFAPMSAADVRIVYRRRIPALTSSNPTNWLLTLAPDVYLYGTLVQASAFLVEDERAATWKAVFDEAIAELRADSEKRKWGTAPLAPRVRRT